MTWIRSESPINAIVSVMMLREGWDVRNVTVVVGLRPYTAKANILPEQAIGRGLRLMFRDVPVDFTERVDIIGNQKFLDFVDDLEKLEDLKLDTFEVGKEKLGIVTILPLDSKKEYDIGLPVLSPTLVRKKTLADEIAGLNVMSFQTILLPLSADDPRNKTFRYEGYDIITLQKEVERDYTIPDPQTSQEVIGYYSRRIAEAVKLPSQFAALAPKVREFFEQKAFGQTVDLSDSAGSESNGHASGALRMRRCLLEGAEEIDYRRAGTQAARTGEAPVHVSAVSVVAGRAGRCEDCLQPSAVRQQLRARLRQVSARCKRRDEVCKAPATFRLCN